MYSAVASSTLDHGSFSCSLHLIVNFTSSSFSLIAHGVVLCLYQHPNEVSGTEHYEKFQNKKISTSQIKKVVINNSDIRSPFSSKACFHGNVAGFSPTVSLLEPVEESATQDSSSLHACSSDTMHVMSEVFLYR